MPPLPRRLLALLFLIASVTAAAPAQKGPGYERKGSVVTSGGVRFEVLSDGLLRMEYAPSRKFTDRPSVVVLKRAWPPVKFTVSGSGGTLLLTTSRLTLTYRIGSGPLTHDNLRVSWLNGTSEASWAPGDSDRANLGGIARSLDGAKKGGIPGTPPGILSRSGYFLLDDSRSPVWTADHSWIEPRAVRDGQDLYLLVYGKDYARALKAFSELSGPIPMIPRWAFGSWITDLNYEYLPGTELVDRYQYTDEDVRKVVTRFRDAGFPLDVLVLDFAWHNLGWKGSYDWSPIFHDPSGFLSWARSLGLKVALNDHPGYGTEPVLSNEDSRTALVRERLGLIMPGKPSFSLDISSDWRFKLDPDTIGVKDLWYAPGADDAAWNIVQSPKSWEDQGYGDYNGYAWYRKWVTIANEAPHDSLFLVLGGVDDEYDLYVNGRKIAHEGRPGSSVYNVLTFTNIAPFLSADGRNLISLWVNDWGGGGGITEGPVVISDRVPAGGLRFNLARKKDAEVFMGVLHKPLIDQGVSFWWVDGGSGSSEMEGLNSQMWTNRVFYDYTRGQTAKRGFIFSRFGGLGSHRYPAFFTGDTYGEWEVLAEEVAFTARGGNVLMPYITHDIGGFLNKDIDFKLYTRWVQFGVFSPILRLHSAYENPKEGLARMPWTYGARGTDIVKKYFKLRYSLLPYIYSYARETSESALPLVRPLYLEYPDEERSYSFRDEYLFGKELLVAPITDSSDSRDIYLPPGEWEDYFTGKVYDGDQVITPKYPLEGMPVFVRSGSIIPRQAESAYSDARPLSVLFVEVYGRRPSTFSLYEDDGVTLAYERGASARTPIVYSIARDSTASLVIGPAKGSFAGQVQERSYTVRLHGIRRHGSVSLDGRVLPQGAWSWDEARSVLTVPVEKRSVRTAVRLTVR